MLETEDTKVKEITEITMDDLRGIIMEAVKASTAEELKTLKNDIEEVNRKAIFTGTDGEFGEGETETYGKSIIDTSYFSRNYQRRGGVLGDGEAMGSELLHLGGPFKKLSPEMEIFGKMLKTRMNQGDLVNAGVDVREYNEKIKDHLKAAQGLSEGVAADGGNLVPVEYLATIVEFATAQSQILPKVWRLPMTSMTMKIPKLVQAAGSYFGGIQLYWSDEAAEKTKTKPSIDQLTFTAHKLTGLIYMTDELIQDSIINLVNYITGLFVRAFQYEMESMIISGSGIGQPLGILSDPGINLVTRATAGTLEFDDVVNLDTAIDENFQNLTFMTRKTVLGALRRLKDTSDMPIYRTDYATFMGAKTVPPSLLGYPIFLTRNMSALGNEGDLVLGDLGMYIWAVRQDMTIARSEDVRFVYDETVYRFVTRQDGKCGVPIAFAILDDATT